MIGSQLKYNKEVYILIIGTALAQGISLLFSPLLARLYTPSEYGLLGIMLAASNVLAEFIHLKYDRTIVLEEDKSVATNILFFCLSSTVIFSILLLIISLASSFIFSKSIGDYNILFNVLPPLMLAMGTVIVSNFWFQRIKNHYAIVYNKLIQMASITAIAIYFGYSKLENGLIIGYLLGWMVVFGFSLFQLYRTGVRFKAFDKQKLKLALVKFKNFPLYNMLPSLLYVFAIGLPFFMVAIIYGDDQGGFFNMCKQLLLIPCGFVAMAFSQVYYRRFAEAVEQKQSLNPLLRLLLLPVIAFATFVFIVIYFFGEDLFSFVLGNDWKSAGKMASIYVFAVLAQFLSIVLMIILPVLGLVKKESIFKFIYFCVITLVFLYPFSTIDQFIVYYTIIEFCLFIALSVYCLMKIRKYNLSINNQE